MKKIQYSLIIPCYNEAKNIPVLLKKIKPLLVNKSIQVVMVNNGSTDDSDSVIDKLKPKVTNFKYVIVPKNKGYGYGIMQGLKAADGDIIGWTHADLQTNPADFLRAITFFDMDQHSFVKGKRFGRSFMDYFLTFGMSVFETLLFKKRMFDINAQPTVFSKQFFKSLPTPPNDFALDLFFYFHAVQKGLTIHRFPVLFGKRFAGTSTWNTGWLARYKFIKRTIEFSLKLKRNMNV
jgi:glycosyltransferase involved in cell wall biosynthesis